MEENDLSTKSPERLQAFRTLVGDWLGNDEPSVNPEADLNDRDYELLKGLGYIE